MIKKSHYLSLLIFLFLISGKLWADFSMTEEDFKKNGRLGPDSSIHEGHYYIAYEIEGNTTRPYFLSVESKQFTPLLLVYYKNKLIAQDEGELKYDIYFVSPTSDDYKLVPDFWKADISGDLKKPGTYTIIVTTKEKGATGKFLLDYSLGIY